MAEAIGILQPSSPFHSRIYRSLARQACDACRSRKARCEAASVPTNNSPSSPLLSPGAQCRRCSRLNLSCTFLLPSKVRGPRKKDKSLTDAGTPQSEERLPALGVLERTQASQPSGNDTPTDLGESVHDAERRLLSSDGAPISPSISLHWAISPQSIQNHFSPGSSLGQTYPTDGLCTREMLKRIMNDYLQYLYPLIPVVHRPSFRQDLKRNRDAEDNDFLGLIIAISATVVGTMPSRFREYRSLSTPIRFQTRRDMMNRCYDMLNRLRGPSYFDEISFQKWAISYCMSISLFQIGEHNRGRMVEVEAMQLGRLLNLHQISEYDGLNCIETQLRKKGFWLLFYGYVHSQFQNLRKERLTFLDAATLNSINLEDLMPLEVDDEMIFEDRVMAPPTVRLCLCTGFIVHSRVFWAALTDSKTRSSLSATDDFCHCVRSREAMAQIAYLKGRLNDLKYMLDSVPPQLRQWALLDENGPYGSSPEQQQIVKAQFATIRANIHVTHLWLQSIILDQLDALIQRTSILTTPNPSRPDKGVGWAEREDICRQLLHVLHSIPQAHIEPNGLHLTYKVRDVAVALLTCPFEPQEPASKRASEYVREYTDILSLLDESETVNTMSLQSWVDTDRVRGSQGMKGLDQWLSWG